LGLLLRREAGFRLGSIEILFVRLETIGFIVRLPEKRHSVVRTGVFSAETRVLAAL
jgi:hypothetical protein